MRSLLAPAQSRELEQLEGGLRNWARSGAAESRRLFVTTKCAIIIWFANIRKCRIAWACINVLVEFHGIGRWLVEFTFLIHRPHDESLQVHRTSFELLIHRSILARPTRPICSMIPLNSRHNLVSCLNNIPHLPFQDHLWLFRHGYRSPRAPIRARKQYKSEKYYARSYSHEP